MKRGETTFHYNNNPFFLPLLVSFSFFPKKADGSVRVSVEEKSTVFYSQERELFHNTGFFQHLHPFAGLSGPAISRSGRGTKKDTTEK